jgi:hypothetical protein
LSFKVYIANILKIFELHAVKALTFESHHHVQAVLGSDFVGEPVQDTVIVPVMSSHQPSVESLGKGHGGDKVVDIFSFHMAKIVKILVMCVDVAQLGQPEIPGASPED